MREWANLGYPEVARASGNSNFQHVITSAFQLDRDRHFRIPYHKDIQIYLFPSEKFLGVLVVDSLEKLASGIVIDEFIELSSGSCAEFVRSIRPVRAKEDLVWAGEVEQSMELGPRI